MVSTFRFPDGPITRFPDCQIALLFAEFRRRGATFAKELSFIDDGLWGFEITDADRRSLP